MSADAAVQEIAEAARLVGLNAPRLEDPARVPSLLPWRDLPLPSVRGQVAQRFYLAAEILADAMTPTSMVVTTSLTGSGSAWPSVMVNRDHLVVTTGAGSGPWPTVGVVVVGYTHQRTTFTRQLRASARAVEGELSFEELFRQFTERLLTVAPAEPKPRQSKAFQAFTELKTWLNLTTVEAAELVGVKRTTPSAWARDGREPRPSSGRRLYQIHSIVRAVVRDLGEDTATRWLESGAPSPRDLILGGQIEAAARSAERLLIGPEPLAGPAPGSLIEEPQDRASLPAASIRPRRTRKRKDKRS
jgi:hypothetical protein